MRIPRMIALVLLFAAGVAGAQQDEEKLTLRYGYEYDPRGFPQKTPQDALRSIVKAVGEDRVDYLLAQLADPGYVDAKVAEYRKAYTRGTPKSKTLLAFRRLVKETADFFREEPAQIQELRLFAREAQWDSGEETAVASVKQIAGRHVTLRRLEERWFLENKQTKKGN